MRTAVSFLVAVLVGGWWTLVAGGGVIYVDDSAGGANDGSDWADAYIDLQSALAVAGEGTEIRVAQGLYRPTGGTDRTVALVLKNGVAIRGGYAGVTQSDPDRRNVKGYPSVLCGNIGAAGETDNSYSVVDGSNIDDTAILDGFTIQNGYAISSSTNLDIQTGGAGLYLNNANPQIRQCRFVNNIAKLGGGGICNYSASPLIEDCQFINNRAMGGSGGAVVNYIGNAVIVGCHFVGNQADSAGGGIYNIMTSGMILNCYFAGNSALSGGGVYALYGNNDSLINCAFSGNRAGAVDGYGGGVVFQESSTRVINCSFTKNKAGMGGGVVTAYSTNRLPTLSNCIVWDNSPGEVVAVNANLPAVSHSIIKGGFLGAGNKNADPQFVDCDGPDNIVGTGDDNLRLKSNSPGLDAGQNGAVPADWLDLDGDGDSSESIPWDLDGNPRFWDCPGVGLPDQMVDMGAYEWHEPWDMVVDGTVDLADLAKMEGAWSSLAGGLCYDARCDINAIPDGKVDVLDLGVLAAHWLDQ